MIPIYSPAPDSVQTNRSRQTKTLNIHPYRGIFNYMVGFGLSRASVVCGCLLVAGFASFQLLYAQRPASDVRIEVKDPSGAAVAATGTIKNLFTGTVQPFETDAQGTHTFLALALGRYRIEVTAPGFATQSLAVDARSAGPISRS